MLKMYLISVIIWLIVLNATDKFAKEIIKNKDIDYKKYTKGKSKTNISYTSISFIPIIRLIYWLIMIYVIGADEKSLDRLFNNSEEDK
jgi:hypothetical protein